jgi:hypothetical protein
METEPPPASVAPPPKAARSSRDVVLSLAVLLVPVFLVVWGYRLLGHDAPPTVDATPAYDTARAAHAFTVLTPGDLPAGWRVEVAQYRSGVLRVGLVAQSGSGAQLVETASPVDVMVPVELGVGAHPDGTVTVEGAAWQRYAGGRSGQRALVLATPGRTVLVVGSATERELEALAASLR